MSPCQSCGACCAAFRVDFHPAELAGGPFAWGPGVPKVMTASLGPHLVRILGTDTASPRCVALEGEIGRQVACGIYDGRPSPCREFDVDLATCNRARQRHGLPPIP